MYTTNLRMVLIGIDPQPHGREILGKRGQFHLPESLFRGHGAS